MSDVEVIALWLGLGAGLVSIVLAIVAMTFAFAVDRRSSKINEQMIRSLQKIESSVEGTATDTKELIKVAWDRMLPGPDARPTDDATELEDESVRAIAAGVAAELKAELAVDDSGTANRAIVERLDSAVRRMEQTMQAQLTSAAGATSSSRQRFSKIQSDVDELSPMARGLLTGLAEHGHLEKEQYSELLRTPVGRAARELRSRGLLTPLRGVGEDGQEIPVYWLSPSINRMVKPALDISDPVSPTMRDRVQAALRQIGYLPRSTD